MAISTNPKLTIYMYCNLYENTGPVQLYYTELLK